MYVGMIKEYKVQQGKQDRLSSDKWFGLSMTLQGALR